MPGRFPNPVDVCIIGGGPAGLATAIAARRRGLSVLVADGAVPPIDKSCGEGLMPGGIDALRQLGIAIPRGEAYPFRGIRFVNDGATVEAAFPRGAACGIRRTHLHNIMLHHADASGVHMLWQTSISGLHPQGAIVDGDVVRARWVVGADGSNSSVRRWAKLDPETRGHNRSPNRSNDSIRRFGFRRHYHIAPWSAFMELHWGRSCQIYVTPVSPEEVCLAVVSSDSKLRLEDALREFPELRSRLEHAAFTSTERGSITVTRRLRNVYRDRTVLVGDASGGVDAITGEGLCLAFRQAVLLGDCLAAGNLARYQKGHRAMIRRPALMAQMMLLMSRNIAARRRAIQVFQANPQSFAGMLAVHVGEGSTRNHISTGIALGWELLTS